MSQRQISSGQMLDGTSTRQMQVPGGAYVNEVSEVSGPPSATMNWAEAEDVTSITSTVTASGVSGALSWTEANDATAISAVATAAGTITTLPFKLNSGTVLAGLTGLTVTVLNATTLAFVVTITGEVTDASGVLSLNDAAFVSGTVYAVVVTNAAGVLGVEKYTAA